MKEKKNGPCADAAAQERAEEAERTLRNMRIDTAFLDGMLVGGSIGLLVLVTAAWYMILR